DNQLLIDSLEKDYNTIITDGCAQHSTQTTTTHNCEHISGEGGSVNSNEANHVIVNDAAEEVVNNSHTNCDNSETVSDRLGVRVKRVKASGGREMITKPPKTVRSAEKSRTRKHVCDWMGCERSYPTAALLADHRRRQHTTDRPYGPCVECGQRFATSDAVRKHRLKHRLVKKFVCDYDGCDFGANIDNHMTAHRLTHEWTHTTDTALVTDNQNNGPKSTYAQIMILEGVGIRKDSDSNTSAPKRQSNKYGCDWLGCGLTYATTHQLLAHVRRSHTGDRPFKCHECHKQFPMESELKTHRRIHVTASMAKRFRCDYNGCAFETRHKTNLIEHKRRHLNIRDFGCEVFGCAKSFVTRRHLKEHMLSHSDVRPYRCDWPGCESAFKRDRELDSHRRTHTGVREFMCPHDGCGKSFVNRNNLNSHRNQHKLPYVCVWPACDHRFADKRGLRAHNNTHEGIRPFKCLSSACDKCFVSKPLLNQHMKVVHKTSR
ncbi:unnamed protein product, partial [Medioppia subpectinata]